MTRNATQLVETGEGSEREELLRLIEEAGELQERAGAIRKAYERARGKIEALLTATVPEGTVVTSAHYQARIARVKATLADLAVLQKEVTPEVFARCVDVSVTRTRALLGDEAIAKGILVETDKPQLKIEKAGAGVAAEWPL